MSIVAAIAVVVIHAGDGGMGSFVAKMMHQFLGWGICTFAVPWFFFASGYFFAGHLDEAGWWSRAVKSRGRTLLIPYVIWCGLYICFSAGLDMALNMYAGRGVMSNLSVGKLLFDGFGLDVAQHPMLVPFWYIRALLLIVLLSPVLVYALRRWRWYVPLTMIPAYIYCCGLQDRYAMPWFLFYSTFSLAGWIYFSVGVLARLGKWGAPMPDSDLVALGHCDSGHLCWAAGALQGAADGGKCALDSEHSDPAAWRLASCAFPCLADMVSGVGVSRVCGPLLLRAWLRIDHLAARPSRLVGLCGALRADRFAVLRRGSSPAVCSSARVIPPLGREARCLAM